MRNMQFTLKLCGVGQMGISLLPPPYLVHRFCALFCGGGMLSSECNDCNIVPEIVLLG